MAETQGYALKHDEDFIMLPKVDFCFKELMNDSEVRKGFLSAILEKKPEEIEETELLPTILQKHYPKEKWGILDVRVEMTDGSQVDIEIQLMDYEDWPERSLFYLCKMFVEQIKEGEEYLNLKKCIHIGILNFNLFEEKNYYSRFHLWEDSRYDLYSDKLEIHILELPKVNNPNLPESELLHWTRFFSGEKKEDLVSMAEKNPYIKKAYDHILDISADEQKRLEYEFHMKELRDKNSILGYKRRLEQRMEKVEADIAKAEADIAKAEQKMEKAEEIKEKAEEIKAEAEEIKAEAEEIKAEAEEIKAEAEILKVEMQKKLIRAVHKKICKGKTIAAIADELEETEDTVLPIYEMILKYDSDYDLDTVYKELVSKI